MTEAALKRAQSLTGDSEGRPEDDWYPTDPPYTNALLDRIQFEGRIWEPACGDGMMVNTLRERGYQVIASDLNDHGCPGAKVGLDFTRVPERPMVENIITNPPFKIGIDFARKANACATRSVALLCKLAFLAGVNRSVMHEETHLTRVLVFRARPKFGRGGKKYKNGGMIEFAWFYWEKGYAGKPTVDFI